MLFTFHTRKLPTRHDHNCYGLPQRNCSARWCLEKRRKMGCWLMGCLVNRSWLVTSRSQMTSASQHYTAGHSGTHSWWHMIYLCCVWVLGLLCLLVLHIAMRSRKVSQTKELVSTQIWFSSRHQSDLWDDWDESTDSFNHRSLDIYICKNVYVYICICVYI